MVSSKKAVVSLGLVIGVLGVGAAASALEVVGADPVTGETTTTIDATPTTEITSTTVEETTTTPAPTTTVEVTTTMVETTTTEAPDAPPAPVVAANAFGQCTAFSGRSQPGKSQAWQRLYEAAGGDIEAYCAQVFATRSADEAEEPSEGVESEDQEAPDAPDVAQAGPGTDREGDGAAKGAGKGKSGR